MVTNRHCYPVCLFKNPGLFEWIIYNMFQIPQLKNHRTFGRYLWFSDKKRKWRVYGTGEIIVYFSKRSSAVNGE